MYILEEPIYYQNKVRPNYYNSRERQPQSYDEFLFGQPQPALYVEIPVSRLNQFYGGDSSDEEDEYMDEDDYEQERINHLREKQYYQQLRQEEQRKKQQQFQQFQQYQQRKQREQQELLEREKLRKLEDEQRQQQILLERQRKQKYQQELLQQRQREQQQEYLEKQRKQRQQQFLEQQRKHQQQQQEQQQRQQIQFEERQRQLREYLERQKEEKLKVEKKFIPKYQISDSVDGSVLISVELAGFKKEDINISVNGLLLTVSGTKSEDTINSKEDSPYFEEIDDQEIDFINSTDSPIPLRNPWASKQTTLVKPKQNDSFSLPFELSKNLDLTTINAKHTNGMLNIKINRKPTQKSFSVNILY
ncbi:hypothetical protein PPL_04909 [Heterostelium album PN500]|uniref:SHSP domain-containing protein n=1 Tax=Heterostelium pallidum (strain ATCC 26659 / Pp 5 / PN500) TaxID=670386 RepID=D3B8W6_HETP5|nr:hypothetical protein PPL_04909 [Heterostelium album PN500]EFA82484.1 hypothetical protein PPL_04909 [Heterostelium album PN500]|eukprot:XP_020434601.1 hypothetical protein PPL_04909 [Heterostelium album PN500]